MSTSSVHADDKEEVVSKLGSAVSLSIEDLSVGYFVDGGVKSVVDKVSLELRAGEILGLAGESGCGKSTVALTAVGYPTPGSTILGGKSLLGGVDLLTASRSDLREIWGRRIAYVAQSATTSLSPSLTVGAHLGQTLSAHLRLRGRELAERKRELLTLVDIPDPDSALTRYPFQFSGGQQQRIAIAIALACEPEILILDEPTTGLDVTTQAKISKLLRQVVSSSNVAALYVSHDLALLHTVCDRVTVMYAGQVVESGTRDLLARPNHPYSEALLLAAPSTVRPGVIAGIPGRPPSSVVTQGCAFAPRCSYATGQCLVGVIPLVESNGRACRCLLPESDHVERVPAEPLPRSVKGEELLRLDSLWCSYRGKADPAVIDVSLTVAEGETVGIVGESGSGKSTLLRAVAGLQPVSGGKILYKNKELAGRAVDRSKSDRHSVQLIFQNPDTALNPRHTVESLVARPLRLFRSDVSRRQEREVVRELLDAVKLPAGIMSSYPGSLSGGQKQRIAIARAFASQPSVLLCDEITSALDVSVQATILELLADLASTRRTAVIFVSHDLDVVRSISDRAVVMRRGEICEQGSTESIFENPQHEYTRALLDSLPELPQVSFRG